MPEAEALPSVNTVSMYLRWPYCGCALTSTMGTGLSSVPVGLHCRGAGSQVRDTLALDVKDLPWLSLATRLSSSCLLQEIGAATLDVSSLPFSRASDYCALFTVTGTYVSP